MKILQMSGDSQSAVEANVTLVYINRNTTI